MATETKESVTAKVLTRIKALPQWRKLSYLAKEVLTRKLTVTDGDAIAAVAQLQPRASHEENAKIAKEILSDPDVQWIEHIAGCAFEEIASETSAKGSKS